MIEPWTVNRNEYGIGVESIRKIKEKKT